MSENALISPLKDILSGQAVAENKLQTHSSAMNRASQ